MARRLPSLTSLRAFEAAARLGSFKKAAEELSVTATAISHRIRALEAHLEALLFVRKVRAVALTSEGLTLYEAVRSGFDIIASGVERVRKPGRASVTLSATPAFAAKWLVPRLAAFQAEYPHIDIRVHASNEPVNLDGGAADLAIRYGPDRLAGTNGAVLLLEDSFAPVVSPAMLATLGPDIGRWPLIHFDWFRPPPIDLSWRAWAHAAGMTEPRELGGIRYSEESHAIQAAIAGQGVALLSLVLVDEELNLGLLKPVGEAVLRGMTYRLLEPSQGGLSEAVAAVKGWLVKQARANPPAAG